jgi:hypothetical protein
MMAVQKHLGTLMLLLSCASAQNAAGPATLQNVTTARQGAELRVEVTLSSPVKPSFDTASNPDRILLDLPDTRSSDAVRSLAVNVNGVRRVRAGQHSTSPLVTRVVLDLDQTQPYTVKTEGNKIIVTIGAVEHARRATQGAPVAATSGNLIGVFRRRHDTAVPPPEDNAADFPTPAPPATTAGPGFEPRSNNSSVAAAPQPLTAPIPQSQPASPALASAASSAAAQVPVEQNQIATAVTPAAPTSASSPSAASPSKNSASTNAAVPAEPETAPVIAKSEESAVSSAPAMPGPSPETSTMIARSDDPSLRTVFKVKYVAEGVAYLEGGRAQGLKEGMKLEVEDTNLPATQGDSANAADPRVVAELEVSGVAETSAVTDIHSPKRPVKAGDLAYLSSSDAEALVQQRALSATRQYPAVISFTEGDTLDEEAREEVPRPPLPSVNRARGRIGFDAIETISHGTSSVTSSDVGMVFRGDITRIGGTYWNLSGYWRGRLTKESVASQKTLQNLINRTYHLNMTYDNPNSTLVAGFGRLYLPWAPSLDTIDGGYFGKRLSKGSTLGVFGGSTPDPSSWDYSPNRVISGAFINFEGGEYNGFHYSSTSGAGVSMVNWAVDRPFLLLEESLS